ncbi:hypothetical protein NFI96_020795 [Prochilodus magdalenae]|nr:hypothetical protein NFI96_020795 [Prochilodus magdalenae]
MTDGNIKRVGLGVLAAHLCDGSGPSTRNEKPRVFRENKPNACDAHEWMNRDSHCPHLLSSETTAKGRAWQNQRGKKTLLRLTRVVKSTHRGY